MKRKRDQLVIVVPEYIRCEICKNKIYNYRNYSSKVILCSYDCYSIWKLSQQDTYLDENNMQVEY